MSIPSSSDEVATRHGILPAFRSSSIEDRCSRARLPWWARAISRSASSFSRSASRSASRRLLTKTIVERCASTSASSSGYIDGQIEATACSAAAVADLAVARAPDGRAPSDRAELAQVLDRDDDLEVELLAGARVDELDRPATGDEPADLLERPLGRREPDPLQRLVDEPLRAARPRARGGRRAWCPRPRAPRRGSASRRCAATRARPR